MTIQLSTQQTLSVTLIKVEKKSDIDKITEAFSCCENAQEPEALLDTSCVLEDEYQNEVAQTLFGKEQWADIAGGLVLFHG
jgi:hypothetical protein